MYSAVKTRVFINVFDEQFGVSLVPSLEGLDGRLINTVRLTQVCHLIDLAPEKRTPC